MTRLEFDTIAALKAYLETSKDLTGAAFQSIDLASIEEELSSATLKDNFLLGCTFHESTLELFHRPIIFPAMPNLPFDPFRGELYSPEELLGDYQVGKPETYADTVDGRCYQHYLDTGKANSDDVMVTLTRRLHDHAMTDALQAFLKGRKVVAIMGGHSMGRDNPLYIEVARLSRDLVRAGYLPASGGGPGAMEATHLGAWFAERTDAELVDAVSILSKAPLYKPIAEWFDAAFQVSAKYPLTSSETCQSLGIPTWLYGHEPPTRFATHIAKYFANSVREEGLLAIAQYGVIFAPGSAGTIQEIFQDATQNHYETYDHASPMIFLDKAFWTQEKPVYPLLKQLAEGHSYADLLWITDSREEILGRINAFAQVLASEAV